MFIRAFFPLLTNQSIKYREIRLYNHQTNYNWMVNQKLYITYTLCLLYIILPYFPHIQPVETYKKNKNKLIIIIILKSNVWPLENHTFSHMCFILVTLSKVKFFFPDFFMNWFLFTRRTINCSDKFRSIAKLTYLSEKTSREVFSRIFLFFS